MCVCVCVCVCVYVYVRVCVRSFKCAYVHVCCSPRGARPGTRMMDRAGQLIAPLLTDTHTFSNTHTDSHTHTHACPHTCLTPVPHGGLSAPEAIAPETSKAQNYSA